MNNRKVNRNTKRRLRRNKQIALLASVAVLLVCIVCGSVALLIDETDPVNNIFNPSQVKIDIVEPGWEDGNTVKENVTIKNTGDVAADIRAKIVVTWQDDQGNIYAKAPGAADYTLELNTDFQTDPAGQWIPKGEYYYWSIPVAGKQVVDGEDVFSSTGVLIVRCTPVAANTPAGYHLVVDVIAEAIQAEGITGTHPWGI